MAQLEEVMKKCAENVSNVVAFITGFGCENDLVCFVSDCGGS